MNSWKYPRYLASIWVAFLLAPLFLQPSFTATFKKILICRHVHYFWKRNIDVRNIIDRLLYASWLRIKPATPGCPGQHSSQLSHTSQRFTATFIAQVSPASLNNVAFRKSEQCVALLHQDCSSPFNNSEPRQGCPTFWSLWATLQDLPWATHQIHGH